MCLEVVGAQAHALRTKKTHGTDVRLIQIVCPDHLALRCIQGLFVVRHVHAQNVRRAEQTVGVLLEAKNRRAFGRLVGANTLEHTEAVMKGMGQHMNPCFLPGHHFAIEPDVAGEF